MSGGTARAWTVIVPLFGPEPEQRPAWQSPALVSAIALDTIEAVASAASVGRIVLVTDAAAHRRLGTLSAHAAAVSQVLLTTPLARSGAIELARRHIHRTWGSCSVAVMPADVPFLRPAELDAALAEAARYPRAVLAAADERGATLLTAREHSLLPNGEPDSYRGHLALGFTELTRAGSRSLQRDVGTLDRLAASPRRWRQRRRSSRMSPGEWRPLRAPGRCSERSRAPAWHR
ncbi:hypothetical protein [Agromyces badenianii]|uniref:hypothetical protein n=1 Tax=Agromyces badenianii TaxID=2080742 RepID=UPI000D591F6D|nr:hypothetical protein [Agromyces badenianii]PWC05657.1 hypothetical protein DCE94_05220 [Agromyces badenianii]